MIGLCGTGQRMPGKGMCNGRHGRLLSGLERTQTTAENEAGGQVSGLYESLPKKQPHYSDAGAEMLLRVQRHKKKGGRVMAPQYCRHCHRKWKGTFTDMGKRWAVCCGIRVSNDLEKQRG